MASVMVTGHGIYMRVHLKNLAVLLLVAGLSACAGDSARYPSLALRSFETNIVASPAQPAVPIRAIVSSTAIATLRDTGQRAHEDFTRKQSATEPLVRAAAGQSVESNARAAALVAMADLASARGQTSGVLANLDLLAVEAATTFAPLAEIEAVRAEVAAMVASEDAAMARLWETMGS
ncbi:MAG: hypothetical protein NWS68_03800 [Erythrobacter sp.]|nr:hypothetical protein [Erythrobacter sp.]